jgi:hypothetical protein
VSDAAAVLHDLLEISSPSRYRNKKCNIFLPVVLISKILASQRFLMRTSAAEQRRLAALDAFRAELDTLESEEIRRRLDIKRIRSEEKRSIAEDVLRRREEDPIARLQPPHVEPPAGAGALVSPLPPQAKAALRPSFSQRATWLGGVLRLIRSLGGLALLLWGLRR